MDANHSTESSGRQRFEYYQLSGQETPFLAGNDQGYCFSLLGAPQHGYKLFLSSSCDISAIYLVSRTIYISTVRTLPITSPDPFIWDRSCWVDQQCIAVRSRLSLNSDLSDRDIDFWDYRHVPPCTAPRWFFEFFILWIICNKWVHEFQEALKGWY